MTTRAKPLFILTLLIYLVCCICSVGFATSNTNPPFTITQVATAPSVNPLTYQPYQPTDTFLDTVEIIYLTLSFQNAPTDSELKVEWLHVATNQLIGQYAVKISGNQNAYFYITQPKLGWLTGQYQILIYANDHLVQEVPFNIRSTQPAPDQPVEPENAHEPEAIPEPAKVEEREELPLTQIISEYTLTKEVDPDTYRPLTPTNRFTPDQPYLYLSISTMQAPANSLLQLQWSYVGEETFIFAEQELEVEDSDTAYFSLSKPDVGWPEGLYKVSIYVNGEFFDAIPFRIVQKTPYDYIQAVGMTYEVIKDTFAAANVTYLFFPTDPQIHLLLTFEDVPNETPFKVLWFFYEDGKRYLVAETPTTGGGDDSIDFWVESPEDGFWIGDYQAEVYIDDELYTTIPFRVVEK